MTEYAVYHLDTAHGIPLRDLPPDATERPAWIDLLSQRLRAGQFRPVGHVHLHAGVPETLLPPVVGYLYIAAETGDVLACPGGAIQPVGHVSGLLGYPNVPDLPDAVTLRYDIPEGGPGIGVVGETIRRLAGSTDGLTPRAAQQRECTAILIAILDRLAGLSADGDQRLGVPAVLPAIRAESLIG